MKTKLCEWGGRGDLKRGDGNGNKKKKKKGNQEYHVQTQIPHNECGHSVQLNGTNKLKKRHVSDEMRAE